jgi:hypothetical protein
MSNISKLYQDLQEGKVSKDHFVKIARREYSQYVSPVNSYADIVTILKGKRLIQEAHKLTTAQVIDRLSPYSFQAGMEAELAKKKNLNSGEIERVREKVAKKLAKDPKAYEKDQFANAQEVEKKDKSLEMKQVGKEMNDKANEMKKVKGFVPEKANTKASKKENKKGKPKGVKLMKENMVGDQIPQAADYKNQEVTVTHDPNTKKQLDQPMTGVVKDQQGSILYVDFGDGEVTPITISVIKKAGEEEPAMGKADLDKKWSEFDAQGKGRISAMEEEKLKISEIVKKLKGFLAKRKKNQKEATEFTVGGKTKYVKDSDAASAEQELRAAGVTKFTKRKV